MKRKIILAGAIVLQTSFAFSQGMSLQQCIDYAMTNQTRVQNAVIDEQIANVKRHEVRAAGLPQISGSLDVKDFVELPTSLIPASFFGGPPGTFAAVQFGTRFNTTAGFDASQLLFSSDFFIAIQASKTYMELSQKAIQRTKIDVTSAVSKAYYTVLVSNERMSLVNANVDRLKKLMDDTKVLNDNGFVEKIDLDRVTVAYNNLLVEKEKIQRLVELGNALLKFQMGMDQAAVITPADKLADVNFTITPSTDKFDYTKRIEYSLFQTQAHLAEFQLKKDRLSYLPNLALFGSWNYSAYGNDWKPFDSSTNWYPMALIGVHMGIPIFNGGLKHYKIQESKLVLMKSQNDLKMIQQSIDVDLSSSRTMLQNASVTLDTQKKNIELAEGIFKTAKLKYDQGVGSNLEVLNAETALKEAQTNYFGALYDAMIAKIDYDKANGILIK